MRRAQHVAKRWFVSVSWPSWLRLAEPHVAKRIRFHCTNPKNVRKKHAIAVRERMRHAVCSGTKDRTHADVRCGGALLSTSGWLHKICNRLLISHFVVIVTVTRLGTTIMHVRRCDMNAMSTLLSFVPLGKWKKRRSSSVSYVYFTRAFRKRNILLLMPAGCTYFSWKLTSDVLFYIIKCLVAAVRQDMFHNTLSLSWKCACSKRDVI
jgi:hypothetical protein